METLKTVAELANDLNSTPRKVRTLAEQGIIPCYQLGPRTLRFRLSEVLVALNEPPKTKKEKKHAPDVRKTQVPVELAGSRAVPALDGESPVPMGASPAGAGAEAGEGPQVQPYLFGNLDAVEGH